MLLGLLFGPNLVGLRALTTGLPVSLLLAAEAGHAAGASSAAAASVAASSGRTAQFTLFSTSSMGDPINCNAPGSYDDPSMQHCAVDDMAGVAVKLGDTTAVAAKVWSTLPPTMLSQSSFFHHGTYTVVHPDQSKVLHVQGATRSGEILLSIISKANAPALGTIRRAPVNFNHIGNGAITCDGVLQPSLTPMTLASLIAVPGNQLESAWLLGLRDRTIDRLNAWAKTQGKKF